VSADVDSLPPTQYLVLEVLAARARLGEACWTFPARLRPALNALQSLGLIWWRHAPIPASVQAYLTDAGREAVLSAGYAPPVTVSTEWGVRFGEGRVDAYGTSPRSEHLARLDASNGTEVVVRRTVTTGPWVVPPVGDDGEYWSFGPSLVELDVYGDFAPERSES